MKLSKCIMMFSLVVVFLFVNVVSVSAMSIEDVYKDNHNQVMKQDQNLDTDIPEYSQTSVLRSNCAPQFVESNPVHT